MGIYAQTDIQIECDNNKTAKLVARAIRKLKKNDNADMNYDYADLTIGDNYVYLSKNSGRIQNLEYQCEILWDTIKSIKGILTMECPFMAEADGKYFSIDEEQENEVKLCYICGKPQDDDGRCACTNKDGK
jgi:transcription initiation factor IIE alpha subunit